MTDIKQSGERVRQLLRILRHRGNEIGQSAVILDFGCGGGHKVRALRDEGYEAYGCDVALRKDLSQDLQETQDLYYSEIIRLIDPSGDYRIPFEDSTFDVVISDQVFEHVQNYQTAISEISRVTKKNGLGLHMFPSRYTWIEPHIGVPFASILQSRFWLKLWWRLGVRPKSHSDLSLEESVEKSYAFLKERTNYLSKRAIHYHFIEFAVDVRFCEDDFLLTSDNDLLKKTVSRLPLSAKILSPIYSALKDRVVVTTGY